MGGANKPELSYSNYLLRPHRLIGAPSLIDPMLHPYDKYNQPPAAKVEPGPASRNTVSTETETDVPIDEWQRRARQSIALPPNLMALAMQPTGNAPLKIGG